MRQLMEENLGFVVSFFFFTSFCLQMSAMNFQFQGLTQLLLQVLLTMESSGKACEWDC